MKITSTKQLREMAYVSVEDITGTVDTIFFPRQFEMYKSQLLSGYVVEIEGTISKKDNDSVQLICNTAKFPNPEVIAEKFQKVYIRFEHTDDAAYKKVVSLLRNNSGECSCVLHFADTGKTYSTGNKLKVFITQDLISELKKIVGENNIVIK